MHTEQSCNRSHTLMSSVTHSSWGALLTQLKNSWNGKFQSLRLFFDFFFFNFIQIWENRDINWKGGCFWSYIRRENTTDVPESKSRERDRWNGPPFSSSQTLRIQTSRRLLGSASSCLPAVPHPLPSCTMLWDLCCAVVDSVEWSAHSQLGQKHSTQEELASYQSKDTKRQNSHSHTTK